MQHGLSPIRHSSATDPADIVANRSLAEALWPKERAVGQTLLLDASKTEKPVTVIGVVSDIRPAPQAPPARIVYRSVAQSAPPWLYFLVRVRANADVANEVHSAVWRVDPDQPVKSLRCPRMVWS